MFPRLRAALGRIQNDLAQVLESKQITAVCREVGYKWRERLLNPITTIHLFVIQILNGNCAIARLQDFADKLFSEGAYCKARGRLPLKVLQTLLERVGTAFRPIQDDSTRWLGHRTFHIDGSSASMPDTPELQKHFGQPGAQRPGCGFPVVHLLTLFHAGTGFLSKVLTAPLRTHDMAQVEQMHPELEEGDVMIGDRGFCSFVHITLLVRRKLHGVFRAHQKQIVNFRIGRFHNRPRYKPVRGLPNSRWLKRLGIKDQLVEYFKPKKRPTWMSATNYAALPSLQVVRELRYKVTRRGARTQQVTLVTTLLDPEKYSAMALAELYGQRWQIETNLAHLKKTMKMDVLHCKTVQGVLKELTVFALVYNLVRSVTYAAAQRQKVDVERISFADALGWLAHAQPGSELRPLKVNPERPGRLEPRALKRRPKEYDRLNRPRDVLRNRLLRNGKVA
jgi:Transposase DDE domain